ncbi:MAG: PfkB family carbohydrate kinase [Myxococcota bacterium]
MDLLVVGSVALDTVETPFGRVENAIGGSAMYFSASSSYFTRTRLVAVVGEDFPADPLEFLSSRGVDLSGLHRTDGKTFRWSGRYGHDLNEAITLDTQLNVFADFAPNLSETYRSTDIVFLANIDPVLQLQVLEQVDDPKFVAMDTMNLWIDTKRDDLEAVMKRVDMVVVNDTEARAIGRSPNVVQAAQNIAALGPEHVVIKRGEYGALLYTGGAFFFAPAYPLEEVYDPTGAGDTFAGGLLGYLAKAGRFDPQTMRMATVVGCTMASFTVEKFSYENLRGLQGERIAKRLDQFRALTHFEPLELLS